jgi:molybdopterin-guanine dinucleotide biosynthesis protein A
MSMDADDLTLGVILAGGASRRMGGNHKGLMEIGGAPMVQHVAHRLAPQVAELAISVHGAGDAFRRFGLPLITDAASEQHGPLAGVLAGMSWARSSRPEARWIVTAPCDAPFCPRDLVAMLRGAALALPEDEPRIAIAASNGRSHFAFGLWPIALSADLDAYLHADERRMQGWIERHSHVIVEFPLLRQDEQTLDPFFNVNTPPDIDTARKYLAAFASQ